MTEWVTYTGSDEQIAEMNAAIRNSNNGILVSLRDKNTKIIYSGLYSYKFDKYLICNPHPLADMICQQARTGQPVWISVAIDTGIGELEKIEYRYFEPTTAPDWNIPGAEYSFTPFDEELNK